VKRKTNNKLPKANVLAIQKTIPERGNCAIFRRAFLPRKTSLNVSFAKLPSQQESKSGLLTTTKPLSLSPHWFAGNVLRGTVNELNLF